MGFVVKEGELKPNSRKIQALSQLPEPGSIMQIRQFIGLASNFKQFPRFSEVMKPLYQLTSKLNDFKWEKQHEEIRQRIIKDLINDPVLIIFDPKFPIELHTDASANGYGAMLLHNVEGKRRVVEYYSKCTTLAV